MLSRPEYIEGFVIKNRLLMQIAQGTSSQSGPKWDRVVMLRKMLYNTALKICNNIVLILS